MNVHLFNGPDAVNAADNPVPRVSIGMPVYNGARYVRAAIDAVLGQTVPDFELIISDNASTDGTRQICEEYAARDPRIRYFRQDTNLGALPNFNFVLAAARAPYFAWAAHDDLREPEYIARLAAALDGNDRAVLASSGFDAIDESGAHVRDFGFDWPAVFAGRSFVQLARLLWLDEVKSQKAVHIYGMMRTDALRAAVGAAAEVDAYSGNDVCTLLELLAAGDFVFVPEVLLHYRVRIVPPRNLAPHEKRGAGLIRYIFARLRIAGARYDFYHSAILRPSIEYFAALRAFVHRQRSLSRPARFMLVALTFLRQAGRFGQIAGNVARRNLGIPEP